MSFYCQIIAGFPASFVCPFFCIFFSFTLFLPPALCFLVSLLKIIIVIITFQCCCLKSQLMKSILYYKPLEHFAQPLAFQWFYNLLNQSGHSKKLCMDSNRVRSELHWIQGIQPFLTFFFIPFIVIVFLWFKKPNKFTL